MVAHRVMAHLADSRVDRVLVKAKEMVQVPLGAKAMVVMVDSNLEHKRDMASLREAMGSNRAMIIMDRSHLVRSHMDNRRHLVVKDKVEMALANKDHTVARDKAVEAAPAAVVVVMEDGVKGTVADRAAGMAVTKETGPKEAAVTEAGVVVAMTEVAMTEVAMTVAVMTAVVAMTVVAMTVVEEEDILVWGKLRSATTPKVL